MIEQYARLNLVRYVIHNEKNRIADMAPITYDGHNYQAFTRSRETAKQMQAEYDALKAWEGTITWFAGEMVMTSRKWGCQPRYKRLCVSFISRGHADLYDCFISETYGNCADAIIKQVSKEQLLSDFMDWFEKKRREFRMKMDAQIAEITRGVMAAGKKPSAHGGVANLLKVLTKTMDKQGADIRTIAKVQYAVCLQAGIYIPDEFVEDVAVALDAMDG